MGNQPLGKLADLFYGLLTASKTASALFARSLNVATISIKSLTDEGVALKQETQAGVMIKHDTHSTLQASPAVLGSDAS